MRIIRIVANLLLAITAFWSIPPSKTSSMLQLIKCMCICPCMFDGMFDRSLSLVFCLETIHILHFILPLVVV